MISLVQALSHDDLLSPVTVGAYLRQRGLIGAGAVVEVDELGGGISNIVLGVEADGRSLVVKQSLPKLRVQVEWLATRERAVAEGLALRLADAIAPDSAPHLLDLDEEAYALTMERAPRSWRTCKDDLLHGRVSTDVARQIGALLARWHARTVNAPSVTAPFLDRRAFVELRIEPYYGAIEAAHPDLASTIAQYAARLLEPGRCLVHGDYSPKNLLVGDGRLWLIDFEVAHVGDPTFDLAFMLNHLFLKAIHRHEREPYREFASAFWSTYLEGVPDTLAPSEQGVIGQMGCLMVARVDGKSPAEYLRDDGRRRARALGRQLLSAPPPSIDAAWALC